MSKKLLHCVRTENARMQWTGKVSSREWMHNAVKLTTDAVVEAERRKTTLRLEDDARKSECGKEGVAQ